jgi:hypothetical protein
MCARGFCWVTPLVHGWAITASAADGAHPWFVTSDGIALGWRGTRWEPFDTGTIGRLEAVWAGGDDDVWVAGRDGFVARWNGSAWTDLGPETEVDFYAVGGNSAGEVWIGGEEGAVYSWNGVGWEPRSLGLSATVRGITVASTGQVWAAGSGGVHAWNGVGWDVDVAGSFVGIVRVADDELWVAGSSGVHRYDGDAWRAATGAPAEADALFASVDGHVWVRDVFVTMADYHRFDGAWSEYGGLRTQAVLTGAAGDDVWFGGTSGAMWHYDGATLRRFSEGGGDTRLVDERELNAVFALDDEHAWATGEYGTVLAWDGSEWRALPANLHASNSSTVEDHNDDVWAAAADEVYVVGGSRSNRGFLERWDGMAWTTLADASERFLGVWGSASGELFIASSGGARRWSGGTVDALAGSPTAWLNDVSGRSASDVWFVTYDALYRYDGDMVSEAALPCDLAPREVDVTGDGVVWVLATAADGSGCPSTGGVVARRAVGGTWTFGPWDSGVRTLHAAGANDVWFAGEGALHHYDGDGWTTFPREATGIGALGGVEDGILWAVDRPRSIRRRQ